MTGRATMRDDFRRVSFPGLFRKVDNLTCVAGHFALFGSRPCTGWTVFTYNRVAKDWALHRVWSFGLFALHHVGEGKSTDPQGWHVTFARITFPKIYGGIAIQFHRADTFRTRRTKP